MAAGSDLDLRYGQCPVNENCVSRRWMLNDLCEALSIQI